MLELDDVPFWVCQVYKRHPTRIRDVQRHNLADLPTSRCQYGLASSLNIFNREGYVRESRAIDRWLYTLFLAIVLEYLQRWTIIAITGQAKMNTSNLCTANAGANLKPLTGERSFRRHWSAVKYLFVELRQSFPVQGNDIGMHKLCHILPPQGAHLGLIDVVDVPAEDALGDGIVSAMAVFEGGGCSDPCTSH
jgi:hypothetical protein